jgi:hypothetical protein
MSDAVEFEVTLTGHWSRAGTSPSDLTYYRRHIRQLAFARGFKGLDIHAYRGESHGQFVPTGRSGRFKAVVVVPGPSGATWNRNKLRTVVARAKDQLRYVSSDTVCRGPKLIFEGADVVPVKP